MFLTSMVQGKFLYVCLLRRPMLRYLAWVAFFRFMETHL